jgi:hypothetical protein
LHVDATDPWDGASTLPDDDTSWLDHQTWTLEPLKDRETWTALDLAWQRMAWQVLQGERSFRDSEFAKTSHRLGLVGPRTHDGRALPRAPFDPSLNMQVDLVENWAPDLPAAGLDFVLGPYGEMNPARPLRKLAAAVMLYAKVHRNGRRTLDTWARDRQKPDLASRRALKALYRAPTMLWDCTSPLWRPLLPLMDGALPEQPVESAAVSLTGGAFDAVVCQFGLMFFPEKEKGLEEMARVLNPGCS